MPFDIRRFLFPASGTTPKLTTERLTCVSQLESLEASWLIVMKQPQIKDVTTQRGGESDCAADSRFRIVIRRDPAVRPFLSAPPSPACCGPAGAASRRSPSPAGLLIAPSAANVTRAQGGGVGFSLCSLSGRHLHVIAHRTPSSSSEAALGGAPQSPRYQEAPSAEQILTRRYQRHTCSVPVRERTGA